MGLSVAGGSRSRNALPVADARPVDRGLMVTTQSFVACWAPVIRFWVTALPCGYTPASISQHYGNPSGDGSVARRPAFLFSAHGLHGIYVAGVVLRPFTGWKEALVVAKWASTLTIVVVPVKEVAEAST